MEGGLLVVLTAAVLGLAGFVAYDRLGRRPPTRAADPEPLVDRVRVLERNLKEIQMEWENVYDRLRRISGRATKTAALERGDGNTEAVTVPSLSRAELLRRHHVKAGTIPQ